MLRRVPYVVVKVGHDASRHFSGSSCNPAFRNAPRISPYSSPVSLTASTMEPRPNVGVMRILQLWCEGEAMGSSDYR